MKEYTAYLKSPIWIIKLTATNDAITSILFVVEASKKEQEKPNEILLKCKICRWNLAEGMAAQTRREVFGERQTDGYI